MTTPPLLTDAEIDALVHQRPIVDTPPWNAAPADDDDDDAVEAFYRRVCAAVDTACRTHSDIEWNHYGSGYASFIDAWFYRDEPGFAVAQPAGYAREHTGLVVLLSRLSPWFAFAEGAKGRDADRAYSYLPALAAVDVFTTPAVGALAALCQPVLESFGLQRAHAHALAIPLAAHHRVPTLLTARGYTQFDALFYWED